MVSDRCSVLPRKNVGLESKQAMQRISSSPAAAKGKVASDKFSFSVQVSGNY